MRARVKIECTNKVLQSANNNNNAIADEEHVQTPPRIDSKTSSMYRERLAARLVVVSVEFGERERLELDTVASVVFAVELDPENAASHIRRVP